MSKEYNDKQPGRLDDYQTGIAQKDIGIEIEQAVRANLRERVASRAQRASRESNQLARLHRLAGLMERHPEVAEIIDLLQGLGLLY